MTTLGRLGLSPDEETLFHLRLLRVQVVLWRDRAGGQLLVGPAPEKRPFGPLEPDVFDELRQLFPVTDRWEGIHVLRSRSWLERAAGAMAGLVHALEGLGLIRIDEDDADS